MRLRVGRKVGRTIYRMVGPQSSDNDILIGMVDDEETARVLVHAYNAWMDDATTDTHRHCWIRRSSFGQDYERCICGVMRDVDP